MFDMGFLELLLVAVVTLLVVGPKELPGVLRQMGRLFGSVQRWLNTARQEFAAEIEKADELKRRMDHELDLASKQGQQAEQWLQGSESKHDEQGLPSPADTAPSQTGRNGSSVS